MKLSCFFLPFFLPLDTGTAMGRFVMDIIQRIAQLESEQIGERVYIGMEQKARTNGGMLGFNIPYGYDYIDNRLILNQEESKNVKEVFNLYLDNRSMKKIAEHLNKKNVPTKNNKKWASQTIATMLKNPLYSGYLHWEDHLNKSDHEIIIEPKIFNKAQKLIKQKSRKKDSMVFEIPEK